jgi:N-acyl amino acid synthase of PEP-CTERM/exosortase system
MSAFAALRHLSWLSPLFDRAKARLADHEAERIAAHFVTHLPPRIARDPAEREAVFRLRHAVYCEELGFEPQRDDRRECDEFDSRSWHAFLHHPGSNSMAGAVRVVTCNDRDDALPMEVHCPEALSSARLRPSVFPRGTVCEISRLAVPAHFRRRASDRFHGAAMGGIDPRQFDATTLRCFPWIAVSLYFSAAAMVRLSGRHHAFVMVEPRLARAMAFVGLAFQQVGPAVNFHGLRAPYYINRTLLLEGLTPGFRRLLDAVEAGLGAAAEPPPHSDLPGQGG